MKNLLRKLIRWIIGFLREDKEVLYKIGNTKHHNAFIDRLTPQFVEIGDYFVSAPGAYIISHDSSTFRHIGKYRIEKVTIGDKVYLGANSVVLPGVTIGDNAIIGAGSVVTKDVAANTVVAGVPARYICSIDEYFAKCEAKNCLYAPPKSYEKLFHNERPNRDDLRNFQSKVVTEAKKRGNL